MKFVESFLSKFKKVDESDRDRLRTQRAHVPADESDNMIPHCDTENTSLGSIKTRSGPSKSITRLRAFVKKKSVEELAAEDLKRQQANEEYSEAALKDIGYKD